MPTYISSDSSLVCLGIPFQYFQREIGRILNFRKALTHEHVFETIEAVGRQRSYRTAAQRWTGIRVMFKTGQIQPWNMHDRGSL